MKYNECLCSFLGGGGGEGAQMEESIAQWTRTQGRSSTFHDIYWLNLSKLEKPNLTNLYFHSNNFIYLLIAKMANVNSTTIIIFYVIHNNYEISYVINISNMRWPLIKLFTK
jgi:hypothetical protein